MNISETSEKQGCPSNFQHYFSFSRAPINQLEPVITHWRCYLKGSHLRESQRKTLDKLKQCGKGVTFLMHKAGFISKNLHAFPFTFHINSP